MGIAIRRTQKSSLSRDADQTVLGRRAQSKETAANAQFGGHWEPEHIRFCCLWRNAILCVGFVVTWIWRRTVCSAMGCSGQGGREKGSGHVHCRESLTELSAADAALQSFTNV